MKGSPCKAECFVDLVNPAERGGHHNDLAAGRRRDRLPDFKVFFCYHRSLADSSVGVSKALHSINLSLKLRLEFEQFDPVPTVGDYLLWLD